VADGFILVDAAMVRPIWPRVDLGIDSNGDGRIDYKDSPLEEVAPGATVGDNEDHRREVKLSAKVDAVYAELGTGNGFADWELSLKATQGASVVSAWDAETGGNQVDIDPTGGVDTFQLDAAGGFADSLWLEAGGTGPVELEFVAVEDGSGAQASDTGKAEATELWDGYWLPGDVDLDPPWNRIGWTYSNNEMTTPETPLGEGDPLVTQNRYSGFHFKIEFKLLDNSPKKPSKWNAESDPVLEHFSNSGLYIFDTYEVQIVDSNKAAQPDNTFKFDEETGIVKPDPPPDGIDLTSERASKVGQVSCGFMYDNRKDPGMRLFEQFKEKYKDHTQDGWNTLEVWFEPPQFSAQGEKLWNARIAIQLNGVFTVGGFGDLYELETGTGSQMPEGEKTLFEKYGKQHGGTIWAPLFLQSHWGSQVTFRNTEIEHFP